ncbi:Ankyrin-1 [Dactylella cylindrospora]|nr:Ankyrin-1 [Dactylella cylindrospora]
MDDYVKYSVGWISALDSEFIAAQCFLDEDYGIAEHKPINDNNYYTLGKIKEHNVVLTLLPDGEYGTSSAAAVLKDMLRSFPNIKIVLMVGIGGGVPTNRDVRLGDIVVSAPRDGDGGVYQYDYGKTIQGQQFKQTGYLSPPPAFLRTATMGLRVKYRRYGNKLEKAVQKILSENPELEEFERPDPSSDRLYKPEVSHPDGKLNCEVACGDGESKLVSRPERKNNVVVHYGLIASGNQVMKDAIIRDKIAGEKDVLCFEMEAAGLMNQFPALIIRGICDYSDSHKNKRWQGYAAMTAAAYAKDLLCEISSSKVEAEAKLTTILSAVEENVNQIHSKVQNTSDDIKSMKSEQRQAEIMRWLSPPNASVNYHKAFQQRHEGSGSWFLGGDTFSEWKNQPKFLWLHGIAGCGKTVLSSAIVNSLSSCQPLLYFYFDFNDVEKQTFEKMIRTLISQLSDQCPNTSSRLEVLFDESNKKQPSSQSLRETLMGMIGQVKELWLVLDALDECRREERRELLSWMKETLQGSERWNVHLIVTSRRERDLETGIMEFAGPDSFIPIQSDLIADDIKAYIRWRVRHGEGLKRWRSYPKVQNMIETTLGDNANGMFRWASCQLDALENCLERHSLEQALNSLPKTLNETYTRIIRNIPQEYTPNAIKILQFLTYSQRPMRVKEAVDAIAVNIDGNKDQYFDPEYRLPDPSEILCYCSSLVVAVPANDGSNKVDGESALQLAHFSVKEYLTSIELGGEIGKSFERAYAKASISKICLAYLLQLDVSSSWTKMKKFPFAAYCAASWMDFAADAESTDPALQDFIRRFFCNGKGLHHNCYNFASIDTPWAPPPDGHLWSTRKVVSELYYASCGGLVNTVEYLLGQDADVNATGGHYYTALNCASAKGHEKVVELLLDKGASIELQDDSETHGWHGRDIGEGTALYHASYYGHESIVRLLITNGAEINSKGGSYGTALQAASAGGHIGTIKLLLENHAEVNAYVGGRATALQLASERGREDIVQLLLLHGAEVNMSCGRRKYALAYASGGGHLGVVNLLLNNGADINPQYGSPALQLASGKGYTEIVRLLLEKGADVNYNNYDHGGPLYDASLGGHEEVVKLLLEKGANFNVRKHTIPPGRDDSRPVRYDIYQNPLHAASSKGFLKIVEMLLEKGADVNGLGGAGSNALCEASAAGYEKIVKLLLEKGARTGSSAKTAWLEERYSSGFHSLKPFYHNALYEASSKGYLNIVEMLLEAGADADSMGGEGSNALCAASAGGYDGIVELLLKNGAKPNGVLGKSEPLEQAAAKGHEKIVKLLIQHGANVNYLGSILALEEVSTNGYIKIFELLLEKSAVVGSSYKCGSALQGASENGHYRIVELLLEHGAGDNGNSYWLGSALEGASKNGHYEIAELLLGNGAEVNSYGYCRGLTGASESGHVEIVELLLGKGAVINDSYGRCSALEKASRNGHYKVAKLLLEKGAVVNYSSGSSPALEEASRNGHYEMVELLLGNGAEVNNSSGPNPKLEGVSRYGYSRTDELLMATGAKASHPRGSSPALEGAAENGHYAVVELLLGRGANVNVGRGHSYALERASDSGHDTIVRLLRGKGARSWDDLYKPDS